MNWIKYFALCLPLTAVLVGCTPKETTKTETTESVEVANPPAESTTTEDKAAETTTTTETKTEKTGDAASTTTEAPATDATKKAQ